MLYNFWTNPAIVNCATVSVQLAILVALWRLGTFLDRLYRSHHIANAGYSIVLNSMHRAMQQIHLEFFKDELDEAKFKQQ